MSLVLPAGISQQTSNKTVIEGGGGSKWASWSSLRASMVKAEAGVRWGIVCVSTEVQVSKSSNKQATFTLLPLPSTLFSQLHFLKQLVLVVFTSSWPLCSSASAFPSHHSFGTALSKVTVISRKETQKCLLLRPSLLGCDSTHPTLPTSHPRPSLTFLRLFL